ncbi:ABC transporter ATP-binding protein [Blastopirellula marina]|uniref:ABC transporter ATP-binding protein n=1 Tax=Blastopirellula marina TaxID=124 RepID=A0A2S8GM72_9BACT|nr:ABC transporter ATP-binding protein [Blastopirellula marina]PQO45104.1 ABC transporter ATP-binding protein [Blastopirellula marina]
MSEPAILLDNLAKSYGAHPVLQDVSLEIPAGQTFALLGRNGAGKTTTIRILLGLIAANRGVVRVGGFDPAKQPIAVRKQVGYLAEDQTMYPWMTPSELCRFLAGFYPTWDSAWARELLNRFELPLHARIGRLSKGQTVKLGLAAALAHRPPIVVLDDPAMGLDPVARKEFNRHLVEHLQAEGSTVLYSSHLLDEVEAVADGVAILDRGQIVRTANTDVLREEVKQFVLSWEAIAEAPRPQRLLDLRRHEGQAAVITDAAADYQRQLDAQQIDYEIVNLTLDEVFEAYVIGRPEGWPDQPAAAAAVSA